MKKEQTLLIVCVVIGLLFVWMNTGLYAAVNPSSVKTKDGGDYKKNVAVDVLSGVESPKDGLRSLVQPIRPEERAELPIIPRPGNLAPEWVKPLPHPAPPADTWHGLRESIAEVAAPADNPAGNGPPPADPNDPLDNPLDKPPGVDLSMEAQLVKRDGTKLPCVLRPTGAFAGQPIWKLLEAWPNVTFNAEQWNKKGTGPVGTYPVDATEIEATYSTIHLRKTCRNEYEEERIRRGVGAGDRNALIDLADWAREDLAKRTGVEDAFPYGTKAVKLGIGALELAKAIKNDLALVRKLGSFYRSAYNAEGELNTYMAFLNDGNAENPVVHRIVGDALFRAKAFGPAMEHFGKAADSGDIDGHIGMAECLLATGDLEGALARFSKAHGSADRDQLAHAYEGSARTAIVTGDFQGAVVFAQRAKTAREGDAWVLTTLGAAEYLSGNASAAAATFRSANAVAPATESRGRTGLGFALAVQGQLDGAKTQYDTAIATDPLNFFDPLVGLGDFHQRRGNLTQSNDYFETARKRDPSNPWILLRLATAKMRDGVPATALELARELVQTSPGCVDGLRVAGLAASATSRSAGSVAERDKLLGEAVRHVERALQKEPANPAIIYEYISVLLDSGRTVDALRVAEKATKVGSGVARRDARVLTMLAYCRFQNQSDIDLVREAIDRANRAEIDAETKAYLDQVRTAIEDWDSKRIWRDTFNRGGNSKLFGRWKEDDQRLGVKIGVGNEGSAQFGGRPSAGAENRKGTAMTVTNDLKGFIELEARFRINSTDTEIVFSIYRGSLQVPGAQGGRRGSSSEIALAVDRDDNLLVYSSASGKKRGKVTLQKIEIKDESGNAVKYPRDGEFHTVRFERTDGPLGKYQVYFDGAPVGGEQEINGLSAQRNQEYTFGIIVDADRGTLVAVDIDEVELTRKVN